ncbi:MAG TPA: phage terminase small subunit P27 family [Tepidisphaeraceae bacterium]|jgi:P27 family predicted phage terminase small subunit
MRGRKPIPTAIKELNGNPGKRALNHNEPKPDAVIPPCPKHLSLEAKKEWRRITKELHTLGIISKLDRAALAAYAQAWGRWCEAEEQLRNHGPIVRSPSGFPIQNPYLAVANKAMEQIMKISSEFGLTPSSRSRIDAKPHTPTDELQNFLNDE